MHKELCYVPGSPGLCIIAGMGNAGGDRSFCTWAAPPAAPLPHGSGAQLRSLFLEAVGMGADPGTERASPAHQTTCTPSLPVFWGRHRAAPQQGRSSRPPQGTCYGRCDVGQRPLCIMPEHSQGQNHHPATGQVCGRAPRAAPHLAAFGSTHPTGTGTCPTSTGTPGWAPSVPWGAPTAQGEGSQGEP